MKADLQYHIVKSIFYIIAIRQSLSYGMVEKWVVANERKLSAKSFVPHNTGLADGLRCIYVLFIILVVCHNLRTSYLVLQTQTLLDFDVHTIAQSGGYLLALVGLLLAAALYDIDKGAVAAELDGTLRNGENLQSLG